MDGKLQFCSKSTNPELFKAACCGLGAVGIVTKVTLQCEPMFNLVQKQFGETLSEVNSDFLKNTFLCTENFPLSDL